MSKLKINLLIDGKSIELNEFVAKILSGTIIGAISSLRDIKGDWTEMNLTISK